MLSQGLRRVETAQNGRLRHRMDVWLQVKIRECGLGLRPKAKIRPWLWRTATSRQHMPLAAQFKCLTLSGVGRFNRTRKELTPRELYPKNGLKL